MPAASAKQVSVTLQELLERPGAGTLALQCSDDQLVVGRDTLALASPLIAEVVSSMPPAPASTEPGKALPVIPVGGLGSEVLQWYKG